MGLADNSSIASLLLGIFLAAVAVAQIAYVVLSGDSKIRVFLVSSALGIFVVIGLIVLRVAKNDSDLDEAHAALSSTVTTTCPDFWSRTFNGCTKNYVCSPSFTLADGTEYKMRPGAGTSDLDLSAFNQEPAEAKCDSVLQETASFPHTDMVNRCNAYNRMI